MFQVSLYSSTGAAPPPAYPSDLDNIKLCDSIAEAMTLSDPLPLKQNATYAPFYSSKHADFPFNSRRIIYHLLCTSSPESSTDNIVDSVQFS